jgi:hypothetical protein
LYSFFFLFSSLYLYRPVFLYGFVLPSLHPSFLSLCVSLNISAVTLLFKPVGLIPSLENFLYIIFKHEPPLHDIWKGEQGFSTLDHPSHIF